MPGQVYVFNTTAAAISMSVNRGAAREFSATSAGGEWMPTTIAPYDRGDDPRPAADKFGTANALEINGSGSTQRFRVDVPDDISMDDDLQLTFFQGAGDQIGWALSAMARMVASNMPKADK
ncbi:MAG: hypothetical protein AAF533_06755 [Acidobacteriota bacterium]